MHHFYIGTYHFFANSSNPSQVPMQLQDGMENLEELFTVAPSTWPKPQTLVFLGALKPDRSSSLFSLCPFTAKRFTCTYNFTFSFCSFFPFYMECPFPFCPSSECPPRHKWYLLSEIVHEYSLSFLHITMKHKLQAKFLQLCPTLSDPVSHGALQARILESVAMPSSTGLFPTHLLQLALALQVDS